MRRQETTTATDIGSGSLDSFPRTTIFAGGVLSSLSDESILRHFANLGRLHNFRRMYNKEKKDSGYAFFDVDSDCVEAFVAKPHMIRNALINCKVAADNSRISLHQKDEMERKLYVSNLPPGTSDIDLLTLFESFGRLTKAYLVRNRADGTCKNFGFVIFQKKSDVDKLLEFSPVIKFRHRKVTIKKAVDRQTEKIKRKGQTVDHRRQPAIEPTSSTKYEILKRTSMLDEAEANYHYNYAEKRAQPVGPASSPDSWPKTSHFLSNPAHPSLTADRLQAGRQLHN